MHAPLSVENRVVTLNFRRVRTHPVFGVALHFRGSFSPRRVRVMRFSIAHPAISSRDLDRNLLADAFARMHAFFIPFPLLKTDVTLIYFTVNSFHREISFSLRSSYSWLFLPVSWDYSYQRYCRFSSHWFFYEFIEILNWRYEWLTRLKRIY